MTPYLPPKNFLPGWTDKVRTRVAVAAAAVAFERVWPALWPATGIAGLGLAAALFGLLSPLPWPIHALVLAIFVTAIALSLFLSLEKLVWPGWNDGARRLERDNGLVHRPLSEAGDVLGAGAGDEMAEALWRYHLAQRLAAEPSLRLTWPRSDLPRRDPKGLRYGVLVLIVAGFAVAGGDWSKRLAGAFAPNEGALATLDAWVEPPAYTGVAPVYLSRSATMSVPAGSVLHLRVHGADHRPSTTLDGVRFDGRHGEYAGDGRLDETQSVRVRAGGRTIGSWRFAVIADTPPTISFAAKPEATKRQALKLTYSAGDDYGVTAVRAIIRPHGREGAPLSVELQVPEHATKPVTLSSFRDLTEHPYAGMLVDITLEARDAAGNTATSATVTFRLPQRLFADPLARALIEQRQNLATGGAKAQVKVARTLDALTFAPELFYEGKEGVYLALRMAYRSTMAADSPGEFQRVQDLLWQTALGLEQGGLLTLADQLRRMQAALMEMMARGAPQEDIDAALERYNELMRQYMALMAQNAAPSDAMPDPNAKVLGENDLDTLLKAIQTLSESGDRMRAMQLLSMLQSMLENMTFSQGEGNGTGGSGKGPYDDALQGMGDLMGRQRQLLDKTYRQRDGRGDPKDGGAKGLAEQQGALSRDLNGLKKKGKNPAQENLDKAEKLMNEAQGALAMSDLGRAGTLQKYVLDELRKGADALAKAGQGQKAGDQGRDPLGRTTTGNGKDGGDVPIPDADVLQRARDILKELRKRAGEQGRPKEELDYIDRLLKQF